MGTLNLSVELMKVRDHTIGLYQKIRSREHCISGPHLHQYRLLLQVHAEDLAATSDALQAHIGQLRGNEIGAIELGINVHPSSDDDEYVTAEDLLVQLRLDNQILAGSLRAAQALCQGDIVTESLIDLWIDEARRRAAVLMEATWGIDRRHASSAGAPAMGRAHTERVSSGNTEKSIRNEELAVAHELKTRVQQGDAAAMNGLGMMYALGRGVPKNYDMALELFRRAALQGQVPGMVNVGLLYDRHTNRPGHSISAYAWLRAALSFGVADEDRDAIIFRLGMIASRIGETNADRAERLASALIDDIGQRVGYPDDRSAVSAPN